MLKSHQEYMQGFAMLFVTKYRESTEVANTPTLGLTEHDTLAFCGKWIKNPATHGRWPPHPQKEPSTHNKFKVK